MISEMNSKDWMHIIYTVAAKAEGSQVFRYLGATMQTTGKRSRSMKKMGPPQLSKLQQR
jgi:hypothetical protein